MDRFTAPNVTVESQLMTLLQFLWLQLILSRPGHVIMSESGQLDVFWLIKEMNFSSG